MFVGLLTRTVSTYNQAKCVSLSNQKCMTRSTLIILHPNKSSQELHYYPLPVNLDRCVRSCNTLCDLSNRLCVANKKKDLNLSLFNMITGINEYVRPYIMRMSM